MIPKKSLGQNFLIDNSIISKIANSFLCTSDDLIIEIGPGKGALTKEIKKKHTNIICYEIDNDLKPILNSFIDDNTKIIYKDILKSDIKEDIKNIKYQNLYILGNLPYYITTPIIKHLINANLNIKEMIFMVQLEVADRFTSLPNHKEYGSITLYLKYFFNIEKLFNVSKNSFMPVPKVESAVIKFTKRENKPNVNEEKYFKLLEDSFRMKRKNLKNNLVNYDFNKIKEVLKKYNLSENVRAEELKEEVFVDIVNSIDSKE